MTAPMYRRPRANVYTALLLIAFIGLVLGIVALYFVMADYKFEFRRAPTVSATEKGATEKGVRNLFPERPFGCFAQKVPDTFCRSSDGPLA